MNRCITRMQAWVRLALDVIRAEWPSFDLTLAFHVYTYAPKHNDGESLEKSLHRLALLAKVDPEQLQSEFLDHAPWRCSMQRTGVTITTSHVGASPSKRLRSDGIVRGTPNLLSEHHWAIKLLRGLAPRASNNISACWSMCMATDAIPYRKSARTIL